MHIITKIDNRQLKLSNPKKILYPGYGITKAEIIQYLIKKSGQMLPLIKNRPLTLIRYPDGVEGKRFYSKNKPAWTPPWISSTFFPGDEENSYILANEKATLAWIGNLAGLEIHPMNVRHPHLNYPDQFIFDLDPSEEFNFPDLKELAADIKLYLETYGYSSYIKTSGGKGLHIYVPIKPLYPQEMVFQSVKKLATKYVTNHSKTTTLKISKQKRKGKVLLDIYRNHKAQSCIAPFSLRGKSGAPISTPFPWDILDAVPHSQFWNIKNIDDHLEKYGNAWKGYHDHATTLHDQTITHAAIDLKKYSEKRNFSNTPEPNTQQPFETPGNAYVVQLHNASNLHYDLRLENNGVLQSWAIPKGLPHHKGIKRLAIRTEDHPLKYLTFEGIIPKNEYGGGEMWVFDTGTYNVIKRTDNKIHFKLLDGQLQGDYLIFKTKENQWLLEKKNETKISGQEFISPMLASQKTKIPKSGNHFYEIKWDGIRAIFIIENDQMKIFSRNGNEISDKFPEITSQLKQIEAEKAILDGEIVYLDKIGIPDFSKVVGRIHLTGQRKIANISNKESATAYFFDLLYLDGKDCRSEPCIKRRSWLRTILDTNDRVRFSESFDDGKALFDAITSQGMEGIMCKKKKSSYQSGSRSGDWLKIKVRKEDTAYLIGWTEGQGDRAGLFGALHLGKKEDGGWNYMGKVGTGFDSVLVKSITTKLKKLKEVTKPISETIEEPSRTHWVEPAFLIDIEYASLSNNGTYREPVFKEMREMNN